LSIYERSKEVRGYSGWPGDKLKNKDTTGVTWGCREYVECGGERGTMTLYLS